MTKVDVLVADYLETSIIGPVQTIKRIRKNYDFYRNNGYDITIFSNDNLPVKTITKVKNQNGLIIRKLLQFARWLRIHSKLYAKHRINYYFTSEHGLLDYYKSLDRHPDIIVFHSIFGCHEYLRNYRIPGARPVLFTHSDGFVFEMLLTYFPKAKGTEIEEELKKKENYVMDNISMNACIARIEQKNLLDQYPQLSGKTCLVINGIDDLTDKQLEETSKCKASIINPPYNLICAGGINGRKGQWMIIEAINQLPKEKQKLIHLTLLGDGPERLSLEEKVKTYGFSNQVTFVGSVLNQDVYKYLCKADVFILMSEIEGLPIALLEALRSGLALIATNVSGIPELIDDGVNGFLINRDINELKHILERIDTIDWKEMGRRSRERFVREYTFERMKSDYLAMLQKVSSNGQ